MWACSNHMPQYSPFDICHICFKKNCLEFCYMPYVDTVEFPVLPYTLLGYGNNG